jgi:molybdopterin molybdotransferase
MAEHTESTAKDRIRFVGGGTEDNIRPKGKEVRKADVVLRAGCKIGPAHIAVLANSGCVNPLVALRPRVGIIATGSELVEPGKKPSACQIRNSNGFQLAAQAANAGAIVKNYGIAIDTENDIDRTLKQAMAENDAIACPAVSRQAITTLSGRFSKTTISRY